MISLAPEAQVATMKAAKPIPAMTPARLFLTWLAAPSEGRGEGVVVTLELASVGMLKTTEVDSLVVAL